MPHDSAIPLDASMWLDDMEPPSVRAPAQSLEDSLQLLHADDGSAHDALAFDDHTSDVHALFPMLSESSFDYDEGAKHQDFKAVEAAFPAALSPILTALPMPKNLELESIPLTLQPRKKRARTDAAHATTAQLTDPADATPSSVGAAIPFPHGEEPTLSLTQTAASSRKRRRRLRSTSLTATLAQWREHEQNVFFMVFKPKWPVDSPTPEQFASLLLERFDAVSDRLKATQKTSHDVESFYNTIVQGISDMLEIAAPHDIDLSNPDEIRIALRCWQKLMEDSQKRQELQLVLAEAPEGTKKPLARELLQSIIRSRRQMLKSKSLIQQAAAPEPLIPILDEQEEIESLEGLLREALEHSSLPSYLYQLAPVEADVAPVVHHPIVRKKSTKAPIMPSMENPTVGMKRLRSESIELYHAFTNGTPLQSLTSSSNGATAPSALLPSFVTPPLTKPAKKTKREKHNQTPPQSSRKKIYIKLRMVPRDTQTKDIVERSGCNPKVELKLSSTKKVSDVLDHMAKKWAKVRPSVSQESMLHFFQRDCSSSSPELSASKATTSNRKYMESWSRRNHDVTCLDIWKCSGKMKNDEYIAVVSYQWCADDASSVNCESSLAAWMKDSTPLLDLLDEEHSETTKRLPFDKDDCSSKDNSPFTSPINSTVEHWNATPSDGLIAQVQPLANSETSTQSLQAFGEAVAFDSNVTLPTGTDRDADRLSLISLPEDALSDLIEYSPNSQRVRRRITPVLVSTNKCQI